MITTLPANLASLVAARIREHGGAVLPRLYPFAAAGGARAVARVQIPQGEGTFICTGINLDDDNGAGGAGDRLGIEVDGRVITPPSDAEVLALANLPGTSGPSMGWPAPFYAEGQVALTLTDATSANGDNGVLAGFHVPRKLADALRAKLGELAAFSLTLNSSGGNLSRDAFDLDRPLRLSRIARTGSEGATSRIEVRLGSHELFARSGPGAADTAVLGAAAFDAASVLEYDCEAGTRVEALLQPNGTTPTAYLTFLGVAP